MIDPFYPVDEIYFDILYRDEYRTDIMSKNTCHCWSIQIWKDSYYPVWLMHKYHLEDPYYHTQKRGDEIEIMIKAIYAHDEYILKKNEKKRREKLRKKMLKEKIKKGKML